MSKFATAPLIKQTLRIPEDLLDQYAERAAKLGHDVEDELLTRLRDCREHSTTGIYLDDTVRHELTRLAGFPIKSSGDLLAWVTRMSNLTVAGVKVPVSPQLATRMDSRRFGVAREDHYRNVVTELLEQFVGMR